MLRGQELASIIEPEEDQAHKSLSANWDTYKYDYIYEMLEKDDSVFEDVRRKSSHREKSVPPMPGKNHN